MPMEDHTVVLPEKLRVCVFENCTEEKVRECLKCKRLFCIIHANRFSPNFCKECFTNLAVVEGKFTRTFDYYNEDTDEVIVTKESCTRYHMDGADWPFVVAFINKLTDDELKAVWNFNFFVMKQIETENENRKIKTAAKLRAQPTPRLIKQTVTTKKTVTKAPDTPEEMRKRLKKQGLPDAVIDQMIAVMTKGA